ncbi:hypothetical protein [uncultured Campylobacter sp.]|jgi:hypothetical protein|uniref:hypothetical protein n=2 Tax=uncultured Campylobacter sp. TaxID=218934 RepID=UPI0026150474|nr:hypothetical protein [uncultured Campylobacter sp.]
MKAIISMIALFMSAFSLDGYTYYSTQNNPKAKGLDLKIGIPNSFILKDGYRPNVVLKFIDTNLNMIMVLIYKSPDFMGVELNQTNYKEFCESNIVDMSKNNMLSRLISCDMLVIENLPAVGMVSEILGKRLNLEITSYNNTYFVFYRDYLIEINFVSVDMQKLLTLEDTIYQVLNSIVINDIYR